MVARKIWNSFKLKVPTKRSVLNFFLYYHYENQETVTESLNRTTKAAWNIWHNNNVFKDFHVKEKVNNYLQFGKA